jgi:hypothetical protein
LPAFVSTKSAEIVPIWAGVYLGGGFGLVEIEPDAREEVVDARPRCAEGRVLAVDGHAALSDSARPEFVTVLAGRTLGVRAVLFAARRGRLRGAGARRAAHAAVACAAVRSTAAPAAAARTRAAARRASRAGAHAPGTGRVDGTAYPARTTAGTRSVRSAACARAARRRAAGARFAGDARRAARAAGVRRATGAARRTRNTARRARRGHARARTTPVASAAGGAAGSQARAAVVTAAPRSEATRERCGSEAKGNGPERAGCTGAQTHVCACPRLRLMIRHGASRRALAAMRTDIRDN